MDMSNLDNGSVTLVRNVAQQGHSSTHNIASNPDSGYLYLVGANIQNGGLVAVSSHQPGDAHDRGRPGARCMSTTPRS